MTYELAVYINRKELGGSDHRGPDSHVLFDRVHDLAVYRPYQPDAQILMLRDLKRPTAGASWPELASYALRGSDYTGFAIQMARFPPILLIQRGVRDNEGLSVSIEDVQLTVEPVIVSLSREKRPGDRKEKPLIVLVYPNGTEINRSFESLDFHRKFPKWTSFPKQETPASKGTRENENARVLMMCLDGNLREVARDREYIHQKLVVAASREEAEREILALTKGLIRVLKPTVREPPTPQDSTDIPPMRVHLLS